MTKNPSTTWYFNDWENDPALKACSLPAQAIWMRFLCIMARSPEPGVLMIGAFPASRQDIPPHVAAHVGQPLDVINAAIEELLTSGTASLDRKKRIINRRMVRAAALSQKRAESGSIGAGVTNGKRWGNGGLPTNDVGKSVGNPSALHDSKTSNPLGQRSTSTDAARASASPDGPPRTRLQLPDSSKWRERLDQFKPWLPHAERGQWPASWGPRPDQLGTGNVAIPGEMLKAWRAKHDAAMETQTA